MSIIGAAVRWGPWINLLMAVITVGATLLSVAVFIASGAWRPSSIRGPRGLPEDEPLSPLVFIVAGGLSIWLFVPALILKLLHRGVPLDQIKPTQAETVVLGSVGPAIALAFMILGTVTRRRRGFATLGLSLDQAKRAIGPAIAGTIFIIPVVGWVAAITEAIFNKFHVQHPLKHELLEILDVAPSPWLRVMIVIGAVIVAPLFEEFVFRGHLQTLLVRLLQQFGKRPSETGFPMVTASGETVPAETAPTRGVVPDWVVKWLAVIVASILFALVHEHWSIRIPIFALSLCFGYMYERTGNLWVPMFMHAMFNGLSIIASYSSH